MLYTCASVTITAIIGTLSEFIQEKETISAYLECVELFFTANNIEKGKQSPVLLTAIGGETYALLCNQPLTSLVQRLLHNSR